MDERQAYEFYKDPANQVPAGPVQRRQGRRMSATVPVRFPQDVIEAVKRLAAHDGLTVSSWIRRVVSKEVQRRQPPVVRTSATDSIHYVATGSSSPSSETLSPAAPERLELECVG
jgi:hypothetical protein